MAQYTEPKSFTKRYGLSIVLLLLFIASWALQLVFQWQEFKDEQEEHNQPIETSEFMSAFFARTFENWQSEFLQLFSMVVLTSFLIHVGSAQSKDSTEKMQQSIDRMEKKLDQLRGGRK